MAKDISTLVKEVGENLSGCGDQLCLIESFPDSRNRHGCQCFTGSTEDFKKAGVLVRLIWRLSNDRYMLREVLSQIEEKARFGGS